MTSYISHTQFWPVSECVIMVKVCYFLHLLRTKVFDFDIIFPKRFLYRKKLILFTCYSPQVSMVPLNILLLILSFNVEFCFLIMKHLMFGCFHVSYVNRMSWEKGNINLIWNVYEIIHLLLHVLLFSLEQKAGNFFYWQLQ